LRITEAATHDRTSSKTGEREGVCQMAALGCFGHRQIMPDLPTPETGTKPYENRHYHSIDIRFLPTLKPEEPELTTARGAVNLGTRRHSRPWLHATLRHATAPVK
jgi:hypothetical protein